MRRHGRLVVSGATALWGAIVLATTVLPVAASAAETLILMVARAQASRDQIAKQPVLTIVLTEESRLAFGEFTRAHVGQTLELRADGRVLLKPIVREPILGGTLQIVGRFSDSEAGDYARRLSGANAKIEAEVVE